MKIENLKQVWMCGGGTQSCAIAALIVKGFLPTPDLAIIADTGRETAATWHYLELVLAPALAEIGVVIERVKTSEFGYNGTELFRNDDLLIPAFTNQTGRVGKLSGFCNRWWKLDCLRVYLSKKHSLTRSKYRGWIGYSFDESRRYFRMMDGEEYKKGLLWFPLVEKRLLRHQSIELVKTMGWPSPPRSRCWMCPNQADSEWLDLKNNSPLEFAEAIRIDSEIRERDPNAWLHSSCKPLSEVDFSKPPDLFERACDSGVCFL